MRQLEIDSCNYSSGEVRSKGDGLVTHGSSAGGDAADPGHTSGPRPAAGSLRGVASAILTETLPPAARRQALKQLYHEARTCERCPQLAQTRTQVVFGAGNADAGLLFVGEAPGEKEDKEGVPFVGAAGRLLGTLLQDIGLSRDDVFIANVLKCRPPQNRDPHPQEIERCEPWLWQQIALIEPTVVVTLGRYATGLLRGEMTPLGAVRGRAEIRVLGSRAVRLFPVLHPAAALYRREPNLRLLQEDFAQIPALMAQGPPEQPGREVPALPPDPPAPEQAEEPAARTGADQLGLF